MYHYVMNVFTKHLKDAIKEKEKKTLYKPLRMNEENKFAVYAKNKTGDVVLVELNSLEEYPDQNFTKIYAQADLVKEYPVLAYAKSTQDDGSYFDHIEGAERYNGKKRSELEDSDFLDPEGRSFPVVNCKNVKAAVSTWYLYKGKMSHKTFKERLKRKAKALNCESSLPDSWKD